MAAGARVLGVIGGSGLYELAGLGSTEAVSIDTPYGPPSDAIIRFCRGTARAIAFRRARSTTGPTSAR